MGSRVTGWRLLSVTPRPCTVCLCVTKWAPVLFIAAIIGWSYYAYVVELCFRTVDSALERTLYLVCYHTVLFMFVWAYYRTVMTPVARVPSQFQLNIADLSTFETTNDSRQQVQLIDSHVIAHALPLHTRSITGAMRYCDKCRHIKPDRCHHCSVCATCVLKMDHHCPWVNNCVGYSNYKFFLLFLAYAFLYCLYIALSSLKYFNLLLQTGSLASDGLGKFHVMFVFVVAALFSVSVVSLLGYHVYLVLLNRSTLEAFRAPIFLSGPDKHGFNMGRVNNFLEVFGDRRLLWLLPVFSSFGDGVSFPTRCHLAPAGVGYGATGAATSGALTGVTVVDPVNTSMGDGVNFPQRHQDLDTDGLMGRQRWLESELDADRSRPGDDTGPGGAEFRVEIG